MSPRTVCLAGAAALALAFAGPASAPPRTTLNVGMTAQDVGRLDPHFAVSTIDRVAVAWMFSGLVRFKPGSMNPAEIEPDLSPSAGRAAPTGGCGFSISAAACSSTAASAR